MHSPASAGSRRQGVLLTTPSAQKSSVGSGTTELFGQPKGLWVLAGTELWDRISFHGMQAMLVLYMTGDLLLHPERTSTIMGFAGYRRLLEALTGPLTPTALATQTFGIYLALLSGLPLVTGWLGDRVIGRRFAVMAGGLLMTAGHFSLAFDRTFLVALALLITGGALLRGNLSAQIKSLYTDGDRRAESAFQYYFLAINLGAFIAPLVTSTVAEFYGWHAGFALAGFGMLIGLLVYLGGLRHLPPDPKRIASSAATAGPAAQLTAGEKRRVIGLVLFWPILVGFWTVQSQIWNVYNVWVRDNIDMHIGAWAMPVPYLQSIDGLAPALTIPAMLWIWALQAERGHEPDEFSKIAVGLFIFAAAVGILALASSFGGRDGRASVALPVMFHIVSNLGYVFIAPVSSAIYSTHAPKRLRGTLLGFSALAISAATLISGWMGGLYETMDPSAFWWLNAAICAATGMVLLATRGFFHRILSRDDTLDEVRVG